MSNSIISYNHHGNGEVEAAIKFVKRTMKKYYETNDDKYMF